MADMLKVDPDFPEEHRVKIQKNVDLIGDALMRARTSPEWNPQYSTVALAHAIAFMAASLPERGAAHDALTLFYKQAQHVVNLAFSGQNGHERP